MEDKHEEAKEEAKKGEPEVGSLGSIQNDAEEMTVDINHIYTPLEEAREEIWRRWNDKALRKKVEAFLGGDIPEPLRNGPKAVLGRNLMSPNWESFQFLDKSHELGLDPVFIEYIDDKFVSNNPDKYYLGRMIFYSGKGKSGGEKTSPLNIVDFNSESGKIFRDVKTLWNEDFVAFHHRISTHILSRNTTLEVMELSSWLKKNGGVASKYYKYYLALFLCHGILVESYFLDKKEKSFINTVVLSNFKRLEEIFGVKPLVVPLFFSQSIHESKDSVGSHWMCYPESVVELLAIQEQPWNTKSMINTKG